jgi:hypothetical protein
MERVQEELLAQARQDLPTNLKHIIGLKITNKLKKKKKKIQCRVILVNSNLQSVRYKNFMNNIAIVGKLLDIP